MSWWWRMRMSRFPLWNHPRWVKLSFPEFALSWLCVSAALSPFFWLSFSACQSWMGPLAWMVALADCKKESNNCHGRENEFWVMDEFNHLFLFQCFTMFEGRWKNTLSVISPHRSCHQSPPSTIAWHRLSHQYIQVSQHYFWNVLVTFFEDIIWKLTECCV